MHIGLIDLDAKNKKHPFPNLALMKISAWHKSCGDRVEWYNPMISGHMDKVYVSKVFSFSPDYSYYIDADEIINGGSGYAIKMENGREVYKKELDPDLPYEIEHIYPDYSIYNIKDTAYGFLTRGCPRGCSFCHVEQMQGARSIKVAELNEFWHGQKNIVLLDPNILACKEWSGLFEQLIDSNASVDFSQGLDARLLTEERIEYLKRVKIKSVHFAWDRYEDKNIILPKLQLLKEKTKWDRRKIIVYCIVGDRKRNVTDEDLERINTMREIGVYPYVMIYDKDSLPHSHELKQLQRWVNNRFIWESVETFEDYLHNNKQSAPLA